MKTSAHIKTIVALLLFITTNAIAQNTTLQNAFEQSYKHEKNAEYTKAIKTIKDQYQPNHYETNLRLGYLHHISGLFTESLAYYQKAIGLMPYAIEPKMGYVLPAAALNQWDKVQTQYQNILIIDPQNTLAHYRIGNMLYGKKEYQKAYKHFEKIVNLYPFDYDGLLMFAWANFQIGKFNEAKILFNKVLLLSPNDQSATEGLTLIK